MKKKIISNTITGVLVAGVVSAIGVGAATMFASSDVTYDNSNSGSSAATVKEALDELYELANNYRFPDWYYEVGNAVYYNPVSGEICDDYVAENSLNNNKTGCMKWYIIGSTYTTIDMILDHNTTARVYWNYSGSNSSGPGTASIGDTYENLLYQLKNDTSGWTGVPTRTDSYTDPAYGYSISYNGYRARLIEANEIAKITGADKALQWDSAKTYTSSSPTIGTIVSYYYLDGKYGTSSTWETKVATSQGASKYAWLYDYTENCTSYGCNIGDTSGRYGYWTSSAVSGISFSAWGVSSDGRVDGSLVDLYYGVRPVITISKS